jgi:hypothetical protein
MRNRHLVLLQLGYVMRRPRAFKSRKRLPSGRLLCVEWRSRFGVPMQLRAGRTLGLLSHLRVDERRIGDAEVVSAQGDIDLNPPTQLAGGDGA